MCFWVPICPRKQPSARSGRGVWGLYSAHVLEVRGWIPSASPVSWWGDLHIKHSAPGADSGAQPNLPDLVGFRHDFPPRTVTTRNHSGTAGGFTRPIGWNFEAGSPQQVQGGGREALTPSTQSQVPTLGSSQPLQVRVGKEQIGTPKHTLA